MNIITKAARMLAETKEITLASVNEKGCPRVCVLSKIQSEGIRRFWVATGADGVKVKHFKENPKAGACYYKDGNSVTLTGRVRVLTDRKTREKMWLDWFIDHFPGGIEDPNYCVLEFEAEEATLWIDGEFVTVTGLAPDSSCGLCCTGCPWKESHGCKGCLETQGKPFYGECRIAMCCLGKGYTHCGECPVMPCDALYEFSYLDPEHGDKPQGKRIVNCRKWAAAEGKQAWDRVLLTSAGFEDMEGRQKTNIVKRFREMLNKPFEEARVLFIPTAALEEEAKKMAVKCRVELWNLGIREEHITVYDMDGSLSPEEAMKQDVIYFTGGDTKYLRKRIKETGFDEIIKKMVYGNKVYVGVSAGSLIATPGIEEPLSKDTAGLAFLQAYLSVHCPEGGIQEGKLSGNLSEALSGALSWEASERPFGETSERPFGETSERPFGETSERLSEKISGETSGEVSGKDSEKIFGEILPNPSLPKILLSDNEALAVSFMGFELIEG